MTPISRSAPTSARAVVAVGDGPSGTFVRAVFDADGIPKGESVGNAPSTSGGTPTASLGTEIGPLTSAIPA